MRQAKHHDSSEAGTAGHKSRHLGRSSGSRISLLTAPSRASYSVAFAVFVPGYSGGTATDSHRLPYSLVQTTSLTSTHVDSTSYRSERRFQRSAVDCDWSSRWRCNPLNHRKAEVFLISEVALNTPCARIHPCRIDFHSVRTTSFDFVLLQQIWGLHEFDSRCTAAGFHVD